ncbi:MAG TPA: hypothetical protein VF644_10895 [Pyrinomonadaceae bacterium]
MDSKLQDFFLRNLAPEPERQFDIAARITSSYRQIKTKFNMSYAVKMQNGRNTTVREWALFLHTP